MVRGRRAGLIAYALIGGCVNNYVVERDASGSTETDTDGSSGSTLTSADPSSAASATSDQETGVTTGDPPPVACQPCSADSECGGPFDRCVDILETGAVCMLACPEAGCESGYMCRGEVSVDGASQEVCVPGRCQTM